MATVVGTVNLNGCNYQLAYDLLGQDVANNTSTVRLYGILNVTNYYVSWSSGSASVHTSGLQSIGTYYSRGSYTVIQRDFTWSHDANGNFSSYVGASLSTTYTSGDTGGIITLPKINRYPILNNGQDFNDEQNPTYNITAFNTFSVRVKIEAGGDTQLITRDLGVIGTQNYTLQLTSEERNTLRALCPNSNILTVRETVCAMNGNTELSASYKDYKMTIVNGNPVFSDFSFEDINPVTLNLTGDSSVNINGYSNIKATIPLVNKAEAIKSATMIKYRFIIGDNSTDITYSDSESVLGIINNATSGTYNVYAIDSRNNSTLVTKLASSVINYQPIYINKQNSSISRNNNQIGENAILTLNGTFWNNDFGEVVNSITSVTYRFKKTDASQWITGTTAIVPTVSQNSFTFTGMIASDNQDTSWDLDSSYNIEITINDELSSTTIELILNSAIPTLSLDKNGVGVMCAYDSNKGGLLQVGGNIIDGGKVLWINDNPSDISSDTQITLSSDDYNYILWVVGVSLNNNLIVFQYSLKNYGTRIYLGQNYRNITRNSDTSYTISSYTEAGGSQNCIPIFAIGYKTNLFD